MTIPLRHIAVVLPAVVLLAACASLRVNSYAVPTTDLRGRPS